MVPDWADSAQDWEAIIAVIAAVGAVIAYLIRAEIRKQFTPNHGTSLRDAVDRIEQHVLRVEGKVDGHIDWHMDRENG